jgi:hypothetical protein
MDAIAPGVAECLHLFGLTGDVADIPVLHVAAGGGPLKITIESNTIGRVEVDALHLAAQALAFGEARHHLERVAKDHAVRPILIVLVKLGLVRALGNAVEIGEQVGRARTFGVLALPGGAQQVVDQHLGVHLLLDVERRSMDHEIAPVLLVLAAPDQLRIEVGVARIADLFRVLLLLLQHRLEFGRRDVFAPRLVVRERLDGLGGDSLGHAVSFRSSPAAASGLRSLACPAFRRCGPAGAAVRPWTARCVHAA